jgi:hypothetical protein
VTRQLVTEHGGRVTFESCPGEGTVFRVWLPLAAPPRPGVVGQDSNPDNSAVVSRLES